MDYRGGDEASSIAASFRVEMSNSASLSVQQKIVTQAGMEMGRHKLNKGDRLGFAVHKDGRDKAVGTTHVSSRRIRKQRSNQETKFGIRRI